MPADLASHNSVLYLWSRSPVAPASQWDHVQPSLAVTGQPDSRLVGSSPGVKGASALYTARPRSLSAWLNQMYMEPEGGLEQLTEPALEWMLTMASAPQPTAASRRAA